MPPVEESLEASFQGDKVYLLGGVQTELAAQLDISDLADQDSWAGGFDQTTRAEQPEVEIPSHSSAWDTLGLMGPSSPPSPP